METLKKVAEFIERPPIKVYLVVIVLLLVMALLWG